MSEESLLGPGKCAQGLRSKVLSVDLWTINSTFLWPRDMNRDVIEKVNIAG